MIILNSLLNNTLLLHLDFTYVNILSIVSWFNLVVIILVNQFGFNCSCWWWARGGIFVPELQQPKNRPVKNPGKGRYSCEFQFGCFQLQFTQRNENIFLKNYWTELHVYVTIIQWCRSLWLTLFYCSCDCESIYFFLPFSIYHDFIREDMGEGVRRNCCHFYSEENSALHLKKKKLHFVLSDIQCCEIFQ